MQESLRIHSATYNSEQTSGFSCTRLPFNPIRVSTRWVLISESTPEALVALLANTGLKSAKAALRGSEEKTLSDLSGEEKEEEKKQIEPQMGAISVKKNTIKSPPPSG